jgi:hypothetical protein
MFLRTTIFQKRPKNPLTCSRRRKVQKISPRHQSKPLKPACDYTLIAEEIFVISAYLTQDPTQLGMVRGGDISKVIACLLIAVGAISATLGQDIIGSIISK